MDPKTPDEPNRRRPSTRTLAAMGEATGGVAHDVGNALVAIVSRASLLKAENEDPAVQEHAQAILRAARSAGVVLDRVRRLLRPQEARDFVRVEAGALVRGAREMLVGRAARVGATLEVEIRPCPHVAGLPEELVQALVNLGANGLDAAGQGGSVLVGCRGVGKGTEFFVVDDGPGIPEALRSRVEEAFFSTKGDAGTGLGLALVRRAAEAHGGRLELGVAPGGGVRATLWLPAATAEVPAPRRATSLELAALRSGVRVLVVDDDEDAREALGALIGAAGFEVSLASGVAEAFASHESDRPGIVVTDLDLGAAQSGWTIVSGLLALDAMLPIIVLSGDAQAPEHRLAGRVSAVLTKPVEPAALLARIRTLAAERTALMGVVGGPHG